MSDPKAFTNTVDVPAFDERAAFNPDRPISGLIRSQLVHLHQVEGLSLPPAQQTGVNINTLQTERDAATYIKKVTLRLTRHSRAMQRKSAAPPRSRKSQKQNTAKRVHRVSKKAVAARRRGQ
jgi:hypothetical protein